MLETQKPKIVFDRQTGKIFCVTKYYTTTENKLFQLEKFEITDQMNKLTWDIYDKALIQVKKKRLDGNPLIICLCGSTRFREEYRSIYAKFTFDGHIVLSVGCLKGDPEWGSEDKDFLDNLHKMKIDLADCIFVINKDQYYGESTISEIKYAYETGTEVQYLEPTGFEDGTGLNISGFIEYLDELLSLQQEKKV